MRGRTSSTGGSRPCSSWAACAAGSPGGPGRERRSGRGAAPPQHGVLGHHRRGGALYADAPVSCEAEMPDRFVFEIAPVRADSVRSSMGGAGGWPTCRSFSVTAPVPAQNSAFMVNFATAPRVREASRPSPSTSPTTESRAAGARPQRSPGDRLAAGVIAAYRGGRIRCLRRPRLAIGGQVDGRARIASHGRRPART